MAYLVETVEKVNDIMHDILEEGEHSSSLYKAVDAAIDSGEMYFSIVLGVMETEDKITEKEYNEYRYDILNQFKYLRNSLQAHKERDIVLEE